jgi:hypothetical protein
VRTTITLDPDVEALVTKAMRERGIGFKQAVNQGLRSGLASRPRSVWRMRTYRMGPPSISLDKALQLAGAMEDEALIAKLALGK